VTNTNDRHKRDQHFTFHPRPVYADAVSVYVDTRLVQAYKDALKKNHPPLLASGLSDVVSLHVIYARSLLLSY
jgi:hypothetical protein